MGVHEWPLILSTLLAAVGSVGGMWSVHRGRRSKWTSWALLGAFILQFVFLGERGKAHGACPLNDRGDILVFISWSLLLFYFLVGRMYRISLIGVFTAPLVVLFHLIALLPGGVDPHPVHSPNANVLHEIHSATAAMAYGALALAAVAGTMFLVLDFQLKNVHLQSGLFRNLPPITDLVASLTRLLIIGCVLLSIGIVAGFLMPHDSSAVPHLITSVIVWGGYVFILACKLSRGLSGRSFSLLVLGWFVVSLGVFAFV